MAVFNEPTKWAQALGATANADVIPDEAGATEVDISKIFPAVFSVPLSQGGKAIPRRTLNGLFKALGEWAFYNQNGGVPSYNADFDYTVGRLVSYNSAIFKCIQDNAHAAPHAPTDKDYWAQLLDNSQFDIDEIVTDLNGKADRSLSNVDNTGNILMAHNASPSQTYDELTIANNTTYTAPADGCFSVSISIPQYAWCSFRNSVTDLGIGVKATDPSGEYYDSWVKCSKGDQFLLTYTTITSGTLRFIYDNGSESEQQS